MKHLAKSTPTEILNDPYGFTYKEMSEVIGEDKACLLYTSDASDEQPENMKLMFVTFDVSNDGRSRTTSEEQMCIRDRCMHFRRPSRSSLVKRGRGLRGGEEDARFRAADGVRGKDDYA